MGQDNTPDCCTGGDTRPLGIGTQLAPLIVLLGGATSDWASNTSPSSWRDSLALGYTQTHGSFSSWEWETMNGSLPAGEGLPYAETFSWKLSKGDDRPTAARATCFSPSLLVNGSQGASPASEGRRIVAVVQGQNLPLVEDPGPDQMQGLPLSVWGEVPGQDALVLRHRLPTGSHQSGVLLVNGSVSRFRHDASDSRQSRARIPRTLASADRTTTHPGKGSPCLGNEVNDDADHSDEAGHSEESTQEEDQLCRRVAVLGQALSHDASILATLVPPILEDLSFSLAAQDHSPGDIACTR